MFRAIVATLAVLAVASSIPASPGVTFAADGRELHVDASVIPL